jgi:hypothetical protein
MASVETPALNAGVTSKALNSTLILGTGVPSFVVTKNLIGSSMVLFGGYCVFNSMGVAFQLLAEARTELADLLAFEQDELKDMTSKPEASAAAHLNPTRRSMFIDASHENINRDILPLLRWVGGIS